MAEDCATTPRGDDDPIEAGMWHRFQVVGFAGIAVLAVVAGPPAWRWLALPLMALLLVWYLALGLRIMRRQDELHATPVAWVFGLGVVALFLPVVIVSPAATMGLFIIAPLIYMTSGATFGTAAVAALLLLQELFRYLAGDHSRTDALIQLLVYLLILSFCYWFGKWISRVVAESEIRGELIDRLQRSQDDVRRLSEENGAQAERERMAREIHDTLAQGFASVITLAQAVESELDTDPASARRHVALMRETAQENLADARNLVAAGSPVALTSGTLAESLRRAAMRLEGELGIEVDVEVAGEPADLPAPAQVGLLRAAQEALANVRKHAAATAVAVRLDVDPARVRLTIRDDGIGFAPHQADGHGLDNMRHRAAEAGGRCAIDSAPGRGTEVAVEVPVGAAQAVGV